MLPLVVEWSLPQLLMKLIVLTFCLGETDEKPLRRAHVVDEVVDLLRFC